MAGIAVATEKIKEKKNKEKAISSFFVTIG
jgi:hypothetical protein